MKSIKWIFVLLLVLVTVLYWVSLSNFERSLTPWALSKSVLYYTGIMSFVAMTVGMILAMRLRTVERWVGGLLIVGIPAACLSLFKQIGATHRASGVISQIRLHKDGKVTEVEVTLTTPWEGHKEGQFAFVTFDRREGHHPFTLSSSWKDDARLTFHIKQLGDYTCTLSHTLHVGDPVTVEGPYGRFDFSAEPSPQIWIAGGIGITPFLSRLEALAQSPAQESQQITLFYSARDSDHALIERVEQLAKLAGVPLHLSISGKNPVMTAQTICENVPDFIHRTVWFCGASGFGTAIKRGLSKEGLPGRRFHQELFEMR
jgi:predicted ferric reductase